MERRKDMREWQGNGEGRGEDLLLRRGEEMGGGKGREGKGVKGRG